MKRWVHYEVHHWWESPATAGALLVVLAFVMAVL